MNFGWYFALFWLFSGASSWIAPTPSSLALPINCGLAAQALDSNTEYTVDCHNVEDIHVTSTILTNVSVFVMNSQIGCFDLVGNGLVSVALWVVNSSFYCTTANSAIRLFSAGGETTGLLMMMFGVTIFHSRAEIELQYSLFIDSGNLSEVVFVARDVTATIRKQLRSDVTQSTGVYFWRASGGPLTNVSIHAANCNILVESVLIGDHSSPNRAVACLFEVFADIFLSEVDVHLVNVTGIVVTKNESVFYGRTAAKGISINTCGTTCSRLSSSKGLNVHIERSNISCSAQFEAVGIFVSSSEDTNNPRVRVTNSTLGVRVFGFQIPSEEGKKANCIRIEQYNSYADVIVVNSTIRVVGQSGDASATFQSQLASVETTMLSLLDSNHSTVSVVGSSIAYIVSGGYVTGKVLMVGANVLFLGTPGDYFSNISMVMESSFVDVLIQTTAPQDQFLAFVFLTSSIVFVEIPTRDVVLNVTSCEIRQRFPLPVDVFLQPSRPHFMSSTPAMFACGSKMAIGLAAAGGLLTPADVMKLYNISRVTDLVVHRPRVFVRRSSHSFRGVAATSTSVNTGRLFSSMGAIVDGAVIFCVESNFSSFAQKSTGGAVAVFASTQNAAATLFDCGTLVSLSATSLTGVVLLRVESSNISLLHALTVYNSSTFLDSRGVGSRSQLRLVLNRNTFRCVAASSDEILDPPVLLKNQPECVLVIVASSWKFSDSDSFHYFDYFSLAESIELQVLSLAGNNFTSFVSVFPTIATNFPWLDNDEIWFGCRNFFTLVAESYDNGNRTLPTRRSMQPRPMTVVQLAAPLRLLHRGTRDTDECGAMVSQTNTRAACTVEFTLRSPLSGSLYSASIKGVDVAMFIVGFEFKNSSELFLQVRGPYGPLTFTADLGPSTNGQTQTLSIHVAPLSRLNSFYSAQNVTITLEPPRYYDCIADTFDRTFPLVASNPVVPVSVKAPFTTVVATLGSISVMLAGGSNGAMLQRAMLMVELAECEFGDSEPLSVFDSPTRMAFGVDEGSFLRGAVIGNGILWLAVWHVAVLLAGVRLWVHQEPITRASLQLQSRRLGLPGLMVMPLMLFLQPTVGASITLLVRGYASSDIAIGCAGLIFTSFPCLWFVVRTTHSFGCVAERSAEQDSESSGSDDDDTNASRTKRKVKSVAAKFFAPRIEWHVTTDARPWYVECYSAVFEEYADRRYWFFAVESSTSILFGIASGLRPQSPEGCQNLMYFTVAIAVAAMLTVFAWPFRSPHGNFNYCFNNAVALVCIILILLAADEVSVLISFVITALNVLSNVSFMMVLTLRLYRRWKKFMGKILHSKLHKLGFVDQGNNFFGFLRFLCMRLVNSSGRVLSFINDEDSELQFSLFSKRRRKEIVDALRKRQNESGRQTPEGTGGLHSDGVVKLNSYKRSRPVSNTERNIRLRDLVEMACKTPRR